MGSPAFAASKGGVTMPDKIHVAGKDLVLNGLGIREATIFYVDVYVAGLYVEKKSHDPKELIHSDTVKRLKLKFVRDVDRSDIVDAWTEGFKKTGKYAALKPKIDKLNSWMEDIKEGQSMVYTYVPGKGITIKVKGKVKGVIKGKDFMEAFLTIWLGPKPPNKGLKKGLLGK